MTSVVDRTATAGEALGRGGRAGAARGIDAAGAAHGIDEQVAGRLADIEARLGRVERAVALLVESGREAALLRLEAEEQTAEQLGALLSELDRDVSEIWLAAASGPQGAQGRRRSR